LKFKNVCLFFLGVAPPGPSPAGKPVTESILI
jgi:hypothetical protein